MEVNREPPEEEQETLEDKLRQVQTERYTSYTIDGEEVNIIMPISINEREEIARKRLENELLKFITEKTLENITQILNDYTSNITYIGVTLGIDLINEFVNT